MTAWDDGPDCKVWMPSLLPDNGASVLDLQKYEWRPFS